MRTLAVIGAGAKGIAIAAKARALAAAGFGPPRVVLVERSAPAADWIGRQGYTDGSLPLGTPPEKDVGYPYPPSLGAASGAVTDAMMAYSWPRKLIAGGTYAD
jgi:mycobactin lysine-N-oxygenase